MIDSTNTPRCFVVSNVTGLDVAPASEFGVIKYLFRNLRDTNIFTDDFEQRCIEALKKENFDCETDFIVLAGNITANVRLMAALMSEHHTVYSLGWDRTANKYKALEVGV